MCDSTHNSQQRNSLITIS